MDNSYASAPWPDALVGLEPANTMDSSAEPGPEPSEAETLLKSMYSDLAVKAVFAIGGTVPSPDPQPVTIRWDSKGPYHGLSARLPITDPTGQIIFSQLVTDCEPATFGQGKQEVHDETYRKAGKMAPVRFSTDFCPYETGVMDVVSQALVESSNGGGLRAALYSLNIYSAPSGRFRRHVDTPRSKDQLAVRHGGREILFDWADENPTSINWAAFYSDCEHEVLEVTGGHRVTLTYNLFSVDHGPMSVADRLDVISPQLLPFFDALKALLEHPEFLPAGGRIGFSCAHAYPHTSESTNTRLHNTLKGIDMLVWQALRRLCADVQVVGILHADERDEEEAEMLSVRMEDMSDCDSDVDLYEENMEYYARRAYIGRPLPEAASLCHDGGGDSWVDPTEMGGKSYEHEEVTWLNGKPGMGTYKELAVAFIAYGNNPSVEAYYTSAAIVATITKRPSQSEEPWTVVPGLC